MTPIGRKGKRTIFVESRVFKEMYSVTPQFVEKDVYRVCKNQKMFMKNFVIKYLGISNEIVRFPNDKRFRLDQKVIFEYDDARNLFEAGRSPDFNNSQYRNEMGLRFETQFETYDEFEQEVQSVQSSQEVNYIREMRRSRRSERSRLELMESDASWTPSEDDGGGMNIIEFLHFKLRENRKL
jgi:hypothetical protein